MEFGCSLFLPFSSFTEHTFLVTFDYRNMIVHFNIDFSHFSHSVLSPIFIRRIIEFLCSYYPVLVKLSSQVLQNIMLVFLSSINLKNH